MGVARRWARRLRLGSASPPLGGPERRAAQGRLVLGCRMRDDRDRYHPRQFEELAADPIPVSLLNERARFDCCERWGVCHGHSK
jgi:hypothetical protein